MKRFVALGVAAAIAASSVRAEALTSCGLVSITGVAFGAYDVFAPSPVDSMGSITLSCTGVLASDTITVDLSRGSSASFLPRHMQNGPYVLDYNLYLDAARTQVWGDGTSGSSHSGPFQPADGTNTTLNVYGRIPALQNAQAGAYGDTIVVTINY